MLAKLSVDQALIRANSHLKRNEILEAKKLYHAILLSFPKNIRAQKGLSNLNKSKLTNFRQNPPQEIVNQLVSFYNKGHLYNSFEQARTLIIKYPKSILIWNILGASALQLKMFDEAINAYKKCIYLNPHYAEAYNNMAVALKEQGKVEEAIEALKKCVSIRPDYAEAYSNFGNILSDKGKLEEAIEAFKKSISANPDYADAYINMGVVLKMQGKLEDAIKAYKKSITLKPDHVISYMNMSNAFKEQGDLDNTIKAYNKILSIKPDYELIRAQKLREQAVICDWNSIEEDRELIPNLGTFDKSIHPLSMLSLEDAPQRHLLRSKVYANDKFHHKSTTILAKPKNKPERIRIGYLSSDFRDHPVGSLISKIIEEHDRNKFEIFGYSFINSKDDEIQNRFIKSFDVFNDVSKMNDEEITLLCRNDNIDIAIDLNGYTKNCKSAVFANRIAPIQINYLGFPGTMGTEFIDYIIADRHVITSKNKKYFTEKKIYLPNTYIPTDNTREFSKRYITRSEMGLANEAFIFCCFNNNYKITHREFDIWIRLLTKVKGSILWLRRFNEISHKNLIIEAKKRGIDASRLVFADKVPIDIHLTRYKLADLFLDTFNFNAHTTTTEALWAGLPVVTMSGKGFAARVAGSLLKNVGLPELVTDNEKHYESLILELATNPSKLATIKDKLAVNRLSKPLFDSKLYTRHLENGYSKAYQNYFDGGVPTNINVSK